MKKILKKILIILLMLTLISTYVSDFSYAENVVDEPSGLLVVDTPKAKVVNSQKNVNSNLPVYTDYNDMVEYVRTQMKNHVNYFEVSSGNVYINMMSESFWDDVYAHTGNPEEGDYLSWSCNRGYCTYPSQSSQAPYVYKINFNYYTTYAEEQLFISRVNQLYSNLNIEGKSEYQKVLAIYNYICNNVVYDYDSLKDPTSYKQYTAYAALIDGTAVCQGYALLFYRLALMAGLDARFIANTSSLGHGWNIVKIGNAYFNIDCTWDAADDLNGNGVVDPFEKVDIDDYNYFLKNPFGFFDHPRDLAYRTQAFNLEHPMSVVDYDPTYSLDDYGTVPASLNISNIANIGFAGDTIFWTQSYGRLINNEYRCELSFYGSGDMWDFENLTETHIKGYNADFSDFTDVITDIDIDSGIESVGNGAFSGFEELLYVFFSEDLLSIGDNAFNGCINLEEVDLPSYLMHIGTGAFDNCENIMEIYIPETVSLIGEGFNNCSSLCEFTVDDNNIYYYSEDGVLYEIDNEYYILRNYPIQKYDDEFIVPGDVIEISDNAFLGNTDLEVLCIQNSVTNIGTDAIPSYITIKTKTGSAAYNYAVSNENPLYAVSSISIKTNIDKLEYIRGNNLNVTGGVITVTLSNGDTDDVLMTDPLISFSGFDSTETGIKEVQIEYFGNTVKFNVLISEIIKGDINADGYVTDADAIYLLYYTFWNDQYPINQAADFNGDTLVTDADAIYLLYYTFWPDQYPLN